MFLAMVKADAALRLIEAWIDETPDRDGQIMDYASTKPEIQRWSKETHAASRGKSYGNLRAMHLLVAAGRVDDVIYDDRRRRIGIRATVINDAEWRKVEDGVYTGIALGGRMKRGIGGDFMRYTIVPSEISLVDTPCPPTAVFTLVKADGGLERRAGRRKHDRRDDLGRSFIAAVERVASLEKATEEAALAKIEAMPNGHYRTLSLLRHAMSYPKPPGGGKRR
jgi:hypothetical protein